MPPFLMNKKVVMVVAIPTLIITVAFVVGISSALLSKKDDGPIEEAAEEIIEMEAENLLGLDEDTFNFDLTPNSKELGPIAMEKIKSAWCEQHCGDREMDE